ncbi:MAG: dTDP-4-dehydrorhamnose 3,5-epimerase family protein [Oligoflexia bacterium]|nr:dTDP-4-dehydrorhamnose 3,5-epimerase family protein [Oligoflexia bacterium]
MNIADKKIEGVSIIKLKQIADHRGKVMHMLRKDAPHFVDFGEVYFSMVNPGVIKGWKQHKIMQQNFAVPSGAIKIVLFDDRCDSATKGVVQEIVLGEEESLYKLLIIPPNIWYGFKGIALMPSIIVNCSTIPHDPQESLSLEITSEKIPYIWN